MKQYVLNIDIFSENREICSYKMKTRRYEYVHIKIVRKWTKESYMVQKCYYGETSVKAHKD